MHSNINKTKCLIVEDDQFKMEGIRTHLKEIFGDQIDIHECQARASAVSLLEKNVFDLAIIDMSIHSHEPKAGAGSPVPLSSGGLEVLFEINHRGTDTDCIILTQYPDIEIESLPIPVSQAKNEILLKFDIVVAGCIRYVENDNKWKEDLNLILEQL